MTRLAAPIVLAELGWMAMGLVDTMVVGRVSAESIAAVGLGTILFYGVAVCASGLLLGMDTLVSQAFGAGDSDDCRHSLIQGVWISLVLIPVVMGLVWMLGRLLPGFGIDLGAVNATRPYLRALNWSAPALLVYFALRRYLQGVNLVRPVMWTLVTANLVNLVANWVLVFGHWGAPRMGAEGAGWATCFSRAYMLAVLGVVVFLRERNLWKASWRWDGVRIRELLRLGLPAAAQLGLEIGVFAIVTMLVGRLSAIALASNQIALLTVSTTYMVPLGISSAAAVRVGHALGRREPRAAAHSGWVALGLGAGVMSAAAVLLLTAPRIIARLFTPEAEVIAAAATLVRIAAFFQLFDGLQVVATGALRGAGNTRTPMLCHFAGYWLVGLPLGALLCFGKGLGAAGLWVGLSTGLILIGIVLAVFWSRAAKRFTMVD
jgi:multidrug resistance protein, MATE family